MTDEKNKQVLIRMPTSTFEELLRLSAEATLARKARVTVQAIILEAVAHYIASNGRQRLRRAARATHDIV